MDKWFNKKKCDRCGGSLDGGRTMSRFNTDCLCMRCAEAEKSHPRYREAFETEMADIRNGNRQVGLS